MPKLGYFCPCGKSFATFAALDKHMGRSCYSAFSQTSVPQLDPEEAAASDAANAQSAWRKEVRQQSGSSVTIAAWTHENALPHCGSHIFATSCSAQVRKWTR